MNYPRKLEEFIIATLSSEGEIYNFNAQEGKIIAPFQMDKAYYLSNYIQHHYLYDFITVQTKKGQLTIHVPPSLFEKIKNQWYEEGKKIFNRSLASKRFSLSCIATCINLYGSRRLESITIPSSVSRNHLKSLAYYIERELNIFTIAENKEIKFPEVVTLFLQTFNKLPSLDSTHLANFLTNKEKNELIRILSKKERECYV